MTLCAISDLFCDMMLFSCCLHSSCLMILTTGHMWGNPIHYQKESIGQFCAINRNCNSQRPTHLVDKEHSNHNTWLPSTPKSSSNMPEWAQKWTPVSPAPPAILAIWGGQTAFRLAWSIQTTLSEYQALSEVDLNTYPIPSLFSSTLRGVIPVSIPIYYQQSLKAAYMYLKNHSNHYPYP